MNSITRAEGRIPPAPSSALKEFFFCMSPPRRQCPHNKTIYINPAIRPRNFEAVASKNIVDVVYHSCIMAIRYALRITLT